MATKPIVKTGSRFENLGFDAKFRNVMNADQDKHDELGHSRIDGNLGIAYAETSRPNRATPLRDVKSGLRKQEHP